MSINVANLSDAEKREIFAELKQLSRSENVHKRVPASPAQLIDRARERKDPKGRNRAAVALVNSSPELRRALGQAFADCPGVTVDLDQFKLSKPFIQVILRLYNLPETGKRALRYSNKNSTSATDQVTP